MQECRRLPVGRQPELLSQDREQLPSAAEEVAVHLVAAEYGNQQREHKAEHPQPCEQDVEEP